VGGGEQQRKNSKGSKYKNSGRFVSVFGGQFVPRDDVICYLFRSLSFGSFVVLVAKWVFFSTLDKREEKKKYRLADSLVAHTLPVGTWETSVVLFSSLSLSSRSE
jgi:hypothetical protein